MAPRLWSAMSAQASPQSQLKAWCMWGTAMQRQWPLRRGLRNCCCCTCANLCCSWLCTKASGEVPDAVAKLQCRELGFSLGQQDPQCLLLCMRCFQGSPPVC